MTYSEAARTAPRWIPSIPIAGLLLVVSAIAAAIGYQLLAPSSSTAPLPTEAAPGAPLGPRGELPGFRGEQPRLRAEQRVALGDVDGALPAGTTGFDDHVPGI